MKRLESLICANWQASIESGQVVLPMSGDHALIGVVRREMGYKFQWISNVILGFPSKVSGNTFISG